MAVEGGGRAGGWEAGAPVPALPPAVAPAPKLAFPPWSRPPGRPLPDGSAASAGERPRHQPGLSRPNVLRAWLKRARKTQRARQKGQRGCGGGGSFRAASLQQLSGTPPDGTPGDISPAGRERYRKIRGYPREYDIPARARISPYADNIWPKPHQRRARAPPPPRPRVAGNMSTAERGYHTRLR